MSLVTHKCHPSTRQQGDKKSDRWHLSTWHRLSHGPSASALIRPDETPRELPRVPSLLTAPTVSGENIQTPGYPRSSAQHFPPLHADLNKVWRTQPRSFCFLTGSHTLLTEGLKALTMSGIHFQICLANPTLSGIHFPICLANLTYCLLLISGVIHSTSISFYSDQT